MTRLRLVPGLALLLAVPAAASAQRPPVEARAALVPDSLTVGTVAHAAVRVRVPEGVRIVFPDSLAMPEDAENAGPRTLRSDTAADGVTVTATWPVTAWRPGALQLPPAELRIVGADGESTLDVAFAEVQVHSVLPPDTAGIEPRPARDVLGGIRIWWPLLLALLLALVAVALAVWAWRRRRETAPALVLTAATPPREAALALLDRIRTLRLIENGEIRRAYILMAEALRGYLDAADPAWSPDLTTTELAALLAVADADADPALAVLKRADLVKFARARVDAATATADLDRARTWVSRFMPPAHEESEPPVLAMEAR